MVDGMVMCTLDLQGGVLAPSTGSLLEHLSSLLTAWGWMAQVSGASWPEVVRSIEAVRHEVDGGRGFPHDVFVEGTHLLSWCGVWTTGRWAKLERLGTDRGCLTWESGTGRPSAFLGRALFEADLVRVRRTDIAQLMLSPERRGRLAAIAV